MSMLGQVFMRLTGVDRTPPRPDEVAGSPGTPIIAGYVASNERNPLLVGAQRHETFGAMLLNSAIVAASTRVFLSTVGAIRFKVVPREDEGAVKSSELLEFVEDTMTMVKPTWARIVRKAALYRYHGFGLQEWTAAQRRDGRIGFRTIDPRPAHTILRWDQEPDGSIIGVTQFNTITGREQYIPRRKLVYLVDDTLTDSPEGIGWARNMVDGAQRLTEYKRLEGMAFQRDFSGTPIIRAPLKELQQLIANGTEEEKVAARLTIDMLRKFGATEVRENNTSLIIESETYANMDQTGEKVSGVPKYGIEMLTGKSESLSDIANAINREMHDLARIAGTEHMLIGSDGTGSLAMSEDKTGNFLMAINGTGQEIAEAMTADYIEPLWLLNGLPEETMPRYAAEPLSFPDAAKMAAVLRDLATAGATMQPDDPGINDVREKAGISRIDLEQARQMADEQASLLQQALDDQDAGYGEEDPKDPANKPPLPVKKK